MKGLDARARSIALVRVAMLQAIRRKPRRHNPDATDDGVPVDAPRTPTLSGGAAAPLDA